MTPARFTYTDDHHIIGGPIDHDATYPISGQLLAALIDKHNGTIDLCRFLAGSRARGQHAETPALFDGGGTVVYLSSGDLITTLRRMLP